MVQERAIAVTGSNRFVISRSRVRVSLPAPSLRGTYVRNILSAFFLSGSCVAVLRFMGHARGSILARVDHKSDRLKKGFKIRENFEQI